MKISGFTTRLAIVGNILFLINLISCQGSPIQTSIYTPSASSQSSLATLTPTATLIATEKPLIPSNTPTNIISTLPPAKAQSIIMDLLENNAGCLFPCWWGIVPGKTSWKEVVHFLAPFASQILEPESSKNPYPVGVLQFMVPKEVNERNLHHVYSVQDGVVNAIEVDVGNIEKYRIDKLLNIYGKPSEVWIATLSQSLENDLPFETVLYYADLNIIMRFVSQAKQINNSILGCPQQHAVATLFFWSGQDNLGFLDIANQTAEIKYYENDRPFTLIQEVTKMSLDEFYKIFSNPKNSTCIETPAELWPSP